MSERRESSEDKRRKRSGSIENKDGNFCFLIKVIGTTIFIANLSKSIEERELKDEFATYGTILSVEVVRDPITRYVIANCKLQPAHQASTCKY